MPTQYIDQFYVMDPGSPPSAGTALTPQFFTFFDNDDDGLIEPNAGDTVLRPGSDPPIYDEITSVWENDTITVEIGGSPVTITGTTFYISGQPAIFTPTDGSILEDSTFVESTFVTTSTQMPVGDLGPPCFTAGTLIDTPDGPRDVAVLDPGDLVLTRDHGAQPVLWVGRREVAATGRFAPVVFAPGAIGNSARLAVSPQHRMLVQGWRAELLFGEAEVLVPALSLVNGDTIRQERAATVTYVHLMFARHEILTSGGAASESYFAGHLDSPAGRAARAELLELFPELITHVPNALTARSALRPFEGSVLVA